ncbi:MAG: hypothetical protein F4X82_00555 [Candidatus Spechtbacteria bacterium SB0662_bin_43]|uniref:DUF975 family protein n=1 Tax=Candidatus Spechtbacteria bacterium SB0662_bin_43 TaxID=2604897 RepID=A0A845DAD2_9BACT|nr:hypothetical protein [Candidatus Spechtbacteria bacterium SB0662_bin_43]
MDSLNNNNTPSRKFLPTWDVVKKSFDLFFDNIGLGLFFVVWYVVLSIISGAEELGIEGTTQYILAVVSIIGNILFYYAIWSSFINITKGVKQSIGDALRVDVARLLKVLFVNILLALIYVVPVGVLALGFLVLPDITYIQVLYGITLLLTFFATAIFAIRYSFVPFVIIEENCSIFEAFPRSAQITKTSRTGVFILFWFVVPIVILIGLVGFLVGIFITAIIGSIIPIVAYRVLRAQELGEQDNTGIVQTTNYESSKKSTRIVSMLCISVGVVFFGVLSLIGFLALINADNEANDFVKTIEVRSIQTALSLHQALNKEYPSSIELNRCGTIDRLISIIQYDPHDSDLLDDMFYGASRNPETGKIDTYVVGTKVKEPIFSGTLHSSDIDAVFGQGHGCECGNIGDGTIGYCVGDLNRETI